MAAIETGGNSKQSRRRIQQQRFSRHDWHRKHWGGCRSQMSAQS